MQTQAETWDLVWQEYEALKDLNAHLTIFESMEPLRAALEVEQRAGLSPTDSYEVHRLRGLVTGFLHLELTQP